MTIQKNNEKDNYQSVQDAEYWKLMYDELEEQMYKMMEMTVDLLEKEAPMDERTYNRIKELEMDLRKYKLFEHRIKVTWLGKLALKYINFKKKLRSILK